MPATTSSVSASAQTVVPRLMKFGGVVRDAAGKPLSGTVDVTFSLYSTEAGGSPLWFETQSVQADELGRYTALLGALHTDGLPIDLFTSGEAHWLGIQVGSETEQQPRVLLVSVPYALKAGDAETLGGKPASAYMLSDTQSGTASATATSAVTTNTAQTGSSGKTRKSQSTSKSPVTACSSVTSDGTAATNSIALFTTACNLESANLVQFNGNLGFGTTTPQARLHIFGPTSSDSDARFNFILGDSTSATAGTGGGILFSGYYNGTTNKAGFANIRGIKENSIQGNYATAMVFDTRANGGNQTERMRITSAGNVGIGTTTPAATLDVNGTVNGTSAASNGVVGTTNGAGAGVLGVGNDVSSVGVMGQVTDPNGIAGVFSSAGGEVLEGKNGSFHVFGVDGSGRIDGSGATLSGTLVATGATFNGPITGATFTGAVHVGTGNNFFRADGPSLGTTNPVLASWGGSGDFAIDAIGTIGGRFVVKDSGNVGIGIAAPATKLEVNGTTQVDADLQVNNPNLPFGLNATASNYAVTGTAGVYGVHGATNNSSGFMIGVYGETASSGGVGVEGNTTGNGGTAGIFSVSGSSGTILLGMAPGGFHVFRVDTTGKVFADGGYASSGADFAESVAVHGNRLGYEPGDVLVIDPQSDRRLKRSVRAYSTLVAGIYSTKPGMLATPHSVAEPAAELEKEVPMAIVGIVPCKVSAENGPVARGDLLVTSSTPGYAMKGTDRRRMLGAVVGKALEPLPKGKGTIQVLVTLQ
ncbi:MAG TPA: hypothetical protein VG028_05020 [Terriglobia bacterium]|nr:hypothetical protein [Terriglobia bacterium]